MLRDAELAALDDPRELALAARLADFPDVLAAAADDLAPHQLAFYLRELAGEFHSYYNSVRVLVPEASERRARLALSRAVRQVIANGLGAAGRKRAGENVIEAIDDGSDTERAREDSPA